MSNPVFGDANPIPWGDPSARGTGLPTPTPFRSAMPSNPDLVRRLTAAMWRTNTALMILLPVAVVLLVLLIALDVTTGDQRPVGGSVSSLAIFIFVFALVGAVYPATLWRRLLPAGAYVAVELSGNRLLVDYGGLVQGIDLALVTRVRHHRGIFVLSTSKRIRIEVPGELVPPVLAAPWSNAAGITGRR